MSESVIEICKHCGTVLPKFANKFGLTPHEREVFDYIARRPECTIHAIHNYVYQLDPTGGPKSMNIISVYINRINEKIAPYGIRISTRRGPGATYRLIKDPT